MRAFQVKFRGKDWDVTIDYDYGYEEDTNAHVVDWHFTGMSVEQHEELKITEEEEDELMKQIYETLSEPYDID